MCGSASLRDVTRSALECVHFYNVYRDLFHYVPGADRVIVVLKRSVVHFPRRIISFLAAIVSAFDLLFTVRYQCDTRKDELF